MSVTYPRITRKNPTCFLFLVDQSESMAKPMAGGNVSKAQAVADTINRLIYALVDNNSEGNHILDRLAIGVIGYGANVGSAMGGELANGLVHKVSRVGMNPMRRVSRKLKKSDGAGGIIEVTEEFPIWLDPVARGKTPMRHALRLAQEQISQFLSHVPDCYPPIVMNITDGAATDGTPAEVEAAASAIKALKSNVDHVLLFNMHVSVRSESKIEFPDKEQSLPDDLAKLLFRMSSVIPKPMRNLAAEMEYSLTPESRGFVFNADLVSMISFLDFGTRSGTSRATTSVE